MFQIDKNSFSIALGFLLLLPIFFIPGGALSLGVAKSMLLVLGVVAIAGVFLYEVWQEKKINIPWHPLALVVALLPLVYLLSALISTPSSIALFGYNFEVGTFGYILLGSLLLILVNTIFTNSSRIFKALVAFFVSTSIVALFVILKILLGGDVLVWGNFFGNMGNPIGNWTDLAVSFGLLVSFSVLAIGMIPMKSSIRILIYTVFVLATALLMVINFSTAFILTLVASILLIFYFLKTEKHFLNTTSERSQTSTNPLLKPITLPIILGVISIIFLINPTISETRGTLGNVVARTFEVQNIAVRPSFSATLGVSKAVLSQQGFLGSGPNTFGRDWLTYKPVDINTTPFWATTFPFGVGFIPTQISSTGILGTILWLTFFIFFILLGVKALIRIPESRIERFTLISTLLFALLLWIYSFVNTPSSTMLMLAFIFSGLFMAVSRGLGVASSRTFNLRESSQTRFISTALLVIVVIGLVSLGWVGFEKTTSAFYFKKAVDSSNTEGTSLVEIEGYVNKALSFAPADIHYTALSRINFARAQTVVNSTTGTPEENRSLFEEAIKKSIAAARNGVGINPAGYQNWVSLGMIYSALVPAPLSVAGAYENASFAYSEASKRNPLNPEIQLLLAQLELNNDNNEAARSFIRNSIALKEDYADAYLMLAQLEIREGNTAQAIVSAEQLALLLPNNPGVYFELGLLKYSNQDYVGAKAVLNLALGLAPDYANAQYYLGLTFAQLGQLDEAEKQFATLVITNPESEEVKQILEELRDGETTFLESLNN